MVEFSQETIHGNHLHLLMVVMALTSLDLNMLGDLYLAFNIMDQTMLLTMVEFITVTMVELIQVHMQLTTVDYMLVTTVDQDLDQIMVYLMEDPLEESITDLIQ